MSLVSQLSQRFWILAAALCTATPAAAMPGFYVGKGNQERVAHSSQVVVMKNDDATVVSVMPDYDGPLEPFGVVLAVPADVTEDRVDALKREFVDRVDQLSAPRFHEFWEMDPCDTSKLEQEWERSMKASAETAFLGGMKPAGTKKVEKELFLDVEAKTKEGEYTFKLLNDTAALDKWLKGKGFTAPPGANARLAPYLEKDMKLLVAEVDPDKIELIGSDRAQLSPIRFWTKQPYDTLPSKLGLLSAPAHQELLVYVLHPERRFEVKNYETRFPPTNLNVEFVVKERMGEFYGALHDLILHKHPNSFLAEYAWPTKGCGQPCPNEPLMIHELLSLGADVFEAALPKEVREPAPSELTEEDEAKLKALTSGKSPNEKQQIEKDFKEERIVIQRRKALVERNQYVLTRLHYRYGKDTLPKDPKLGPAEHVKGGTDLPKGKDGEAATAVQTANASQLQTRYNHLHPNKKVIKCDKPQRYRWGKAPREYRGLRKVWVVEDIARKSRKQIKPEKVVLTPVADLGLGKKTELKTSVAPTRPDTNAETKQSCGCRVPGDDTRSSFAYALPIAALASAFLRRRRARRERR